MQIAGLCDQVHSVVLGACQFSLTGISFSLITVMAMFTVGVCVSVLALACLSSHTEIVGKSQGTEDGGGDS